jgi:hypothetical protein
VGGNMEYPFYIYLHTNGELIYKNAFCVDSMGAWDYFDSDFVVKWWFVENEEQLCDVKVVSKRLIK